LDIQKPRPSSLPSGPPVRALQIRREQIKVIYRHLPAVLAISCLRDGRTGAKAIERLQRKHGRTIPAPIASGDSVRFNSPCTGDIL